ncbi:MAG TPA: SsrA-binding protein [Candidatus Woesebacteria bacterium]|nr:SsrA-binding protein [Candidatus Woesebacteria bacterium]
MKHFNQDCRDYRFIDKFEAGLVLTGAEAKSLRTQTAQFASAKVEIRQGVPYLENLRLSPYKYAHSQPIDPTRPRQLLLKEKEIAKLISYRRQKYTLLPIRIFLRGKWFKLEIGVGRKIKKYEKREKIKTREFQKFHFV